MRKVFDSTSAKWRVTLPVGVAALAVGAWPAFGAVGIHTLFTDKVVDEAAPSFAVGNVSGLEGDDTTEDMGDDEAMAD